MSDLDKFSDTEILAKTIWGEARGETYVGQKAVANVVMNRVKSGIRWWGVDVRSVCLKSYQFSCWNLSNVNRAKLLAVTTDDFEYRTCLTIAELAIEGVLTDNTKGADSYEVVGTHADWTDDSRRTVIIGKHEFFRLGSDT